jgi:hypothetical protein
LRLARFISGKLLRKESGRSEDLVDVVGHFGRMFPVSIPAFGGFSIVLGFIEGTYLI